MSSPLPKLPASPLGDLPDNPLGAPPRPPLIGTRELLRLPVGRHFRRGGNGGRGGGGSPLPSLQRLSQRQQPAPAPAPAAPRHPAPAPAPIIIQPRPHAPPAAPPPQAAQPPLRRRTAAEARHEAQDHLAAVLGPQIAHHPLMGDADIRDRLGRYSAAHARGFLARAHDAALTSAQQDTLQAQRENPGYTPPDARPDARQGPGLTPQQRAQMAANAAQMRAALNNQGPNPMAGPMRHMGQQPGGQQPPAPGGQP